MQYLAYGGPERVARAEVPVPVPGPTQLLVRVDASSVNPVDWKLHDGRYRWILPVRFPSIPGFDIAGEVVEAGEQVSRFKPGDRVFAMLDVPAGGAAAEYAVAREDAAATAPSNLSAAEAAAIPLAGLTALQAVRDLARVSAGQRVLVIGASGGVGHLAVQIARARGAEITAVCSGKNAEWVRGLGASRVIDYKSQSDLRGPQPYDAVLDFVVRAPIRTLLPLLAPAGIYVSSLPSPGRIAAALLLRLFSKRRVRDVRVRPSAADLDELRALCESGRLRPVIERTYPLSELAAAHAWSRHGSAAGKLVILTGSG